METFNKQYFNTKIWDSEMVNIIYGELVATSENLEGIGINFGKIRETES